MENNQLMIISGIVLSLAMAYIPPLKVRYDKLDDPGKVGIMVAAMAITAVGGYIAGCYTPWALVECSNIGIWQMAEMFITGLLVNQVTHRVAVRPMKPEPIDPWEQGPFKGYRGGGGQGSG